MSRRIFLCAGTWKYEHEPQLDVPKLEASVARLEEFFAGRLGYEQSLPEIRQNPTSSELTRRLDRWFGSADRQASDWVVLYYTGHGKVAADQELYLLTSDYESAFTPSTAFSAARLASFLTAQNATMEDRKSKRVLLILDTCFSGASVVPLAQMLRARFTQSGEGAMFYVLASALPAEEAVAGGLAAALIDALQDPSLGGAHQEFVYFDELMPAINRRLKTHKAIRLALDSPDEIPQFFRNLRYLPGAREGATVREIREAVERNELQQHWDPKSRGVESGTQKGDFFVGRKRALGEIRKWFGDGLDTKPFVVTGRPGSGKSAILSRFLTTRKDVDCAIHAKGKTVEDVVGRVAGVLGVSAKADAVLQALQGREQPFRIVVDALDESREPGRVAEQFLLPLAMAPKAKLLVGARPEAVKTFAGLGHRMEADDAGYVSRDDLVKYVMARLGSKGKAARAAAEAVAKVSYPNFLLTRLAAENLLETGYRVAPAKLPSTVDEAFQQYLARFGEDRKRVQDLLTPLAWAEGEGLPWCDLWSEVASALPGAARRYTNEDVEWLMEHASSFVVEAIDQGRSVYRLYHQALADYLVKVSAAEVEVQRAFVRAMTPADGDWDATHPYVRLHLAEHAAAAGLLEELMGDASFLRAADVTRLLAAIPASIVPLPPELVGAFKAASYHLRSKGRAEGAAYLELAARQNRAELRGVEVEGAPWSTPWAHWVPPSAHNVVAEGDAEITALDTAVWAGATVAIVGRANGLVEMWDLRSNARIVSWQAGKGRIHHVGIGEGVLVAAHSRTVLASYEIASGRVTAVETGEGERDSITACRVVEHRGASIVVTAHYNLSLRQWRLPGLTPEVVREKATKGTIYDLLAVVVNGEEILVTGGDHLNRSDGDSFDDSVLHFWSMADLSLLWKDRRGFDKGYVEHLRLAKRGGKSHVMVTGVNIAEIWDVEKRTAQDVGQRWHWLWLYDSHGVEHLLAHDSDRLHIFNPRQGDSLRNVPGTSFSEIVDLCGSTVLLGVSQTQLRVWDVEELIHRERSDDLDARDRIFSLAMGDSVLCAGTGFQFVVLHEPVSGEVTARVYLPRHSSEHMGAAEVVRWEATGSRFVAAVDGKVAVLRSEKRIVVDTRGRIDNLRLCEWRGHRIALTTGRTGQLCSARVWDLDSGAEMFRDRRFYLKHGEEDKTLHGLAVATIGDDVRFAFAGEYGKVMTAWFSRAPHLWKDYEEWHLPFGDIVISALETLMEDRRTLLAVATERGDLAAFDFATGDSLVRKRGAHRGWIVVMEARAGRLMTGGLDGFVRVWNSALEMLVEVDLGEPVTAVTWMGDDRIAVGSRRGLMAIRLRGW